MPVYGLSNTGFRNDFLPFDTVSLRGSHYPPLGNLNLYYHSPTHSDSSSGGDGSSQTVAQPVHSQFASNVQQSIHNQFQTPQSWSGSTPQFEDDAPFVPPPESHRQQTQPMMNPHYHQLAPSAHIQSMGYEYTRSGAPYMSQGSMQQQDLHVDNQGNSPMSDHSFDDDRSPGPHSPHSRSGHGCGHEAYASQGPRSGSDQYGTYEPHRAGRHEGSQQLAGRGGPSSSAQSYYRPRTHYPPDLDPVGSTITTFPASQPQPAPQQPPAPSSSRHSASSSTYSSPVDIPDPGPQLRTQLGIETGIDLNLQALPDPPPGEKPRQPYPVLVQLAIYGSARKRLTLQEIYAALEERFEWFRDRKNQSQWKNSIRHNLSLNKVFRQVPRPITEPGKGKYWTVDLSHGLGNKRVRKRNRNKKKADQSDPERDSSPEETEEEDEANTPPPASGASGSREPQQGSNITAADETNIDPRLRDEGHTVGAGRTRPPTRRQNVSPYPSPPTAPLRLPQVQQSSSSSANVQFPNSPPLQTPYQNYPPTSHQSLSTVTQSAPANLGGAPRFGQSSFGQPAFGQSTFGQPTPTRPPPMPMSSSSTPFPSAFMASGNVSMAPVPTSSARTGMGQQYASGMSFDRNAPIIPEPTPRPGVEYYEQAGLRRARRVPVQGQGPSPPAGVSPPGGAQGGSGSMMPSHHHQSGSPRPHDMRDPRSSQ